MQETYETRPIFAERKVLDLGYVRLIRTYGYDEEIIEAARMSTDKGFKGWGTDQHTDGCSYVGTPIRTFCLECEQGPGDEKLLAYLYNKKHMTPFEMAGMIIEVKAPIFVFREWHRHRTQSYNEMSARYVPLPDENYTPTAERCMVVGGANKQANSVDGAVLTHENALMWLEMLQKSYELAQSTYEFGLEVGVPKELARLPVPVARYSKMRANTCLRNWLAFLTLRYDAAAQWEIREFAKEVANLIEDNFPRTFDLWLGRPFLKIESKA